MDSVYVREGPLIDLVDREWILGFGLFRFISVILFN